MSCLDLLPIEIVAKLLAQASSKDQPHNLDLSPHIAPHAVGQLLLLCKRAAAAVHSAAFWQECWVCSKTTALHDPRHAAWVSRLSVDLSSSAPNYHADTALGRCCYQPLLPRLRQLRVCSGLLIYSRCCTLGIRHTVSSSMQASGQPHSRMMIGLDPAHDEACKL